MSLGRISHYEPAHAVDHLLNVLRSVLLVIPVRGFVPEIQPPSDKLLLKSVVCLRLCQIGIYGVSLTRNIPAILLLSDVNAILLGELP
jgi:hypothetical protein